MDTAPLPLLLRRKVTKQPSPRLSRARVLMAVIFAIFVTGAAIALKLTNQGTAGRLKARWRRLRRVTFIALQYIENSGFGCLFRERRPSLPNGLFQAARSLTGRNQLTA